MLEAANLIESTAMDKHRDTILLVGRVLLGIIFVMSGFGKLTHLDAFAASLAQRGVAMSGPLSILGACVEFFGGLAIVLGIGTQWVSVLMILFVIVATGISHRYWELADAARRTQEVQFNKNLAIIGGFLLLFASGGGRFSVDALLRRKRPAN